MPPHPRFLRPRPFPPRPPPPLITALFGRYYERVRLLIRSLTDCPLGFPPRPGIASATAGRMRSPRFRRLPFVRDGVFDHGRASAPRKTAPHMLPSAVSTDSASARLALSRLNSPPHTIAVYASRRSSPSAPQHSLPSARYGLLGPDLHRLDAASFAWRTDSRLFADFRAPRMAPERRHGSGGGRLALSCESRMCSGATRPASDRKPYISDRNPWLTLLATYAVGQAGKGSPRELAPLAEPYHASM